MVWPALSAACENTVANMVPTSVLSPETVTAGFCFSGSCYRISKLVSFIYGLGTFLIVAFVLDLRVNKLCKSFNSGFNIPYSSMVPLNFIPTEFQNQAFWGLSFLVLDLRVRMPDLRHSPFTP